MSTNNNLTANKDDLIKQIQSLCKNIDAERTLRKETQAGYRDENDSIRNTKTQATEELNNIKHVNGNTIEQIKRSIMHTQTKNIEEIISLRAEWEKSFPHNQNL